MSRLRLLVGGLTAVAAVVIALAVRHVASAQAAPAEALRGRPLSAAPLRPGEAESPTGRRPLAFWTGHRQAIWTALAERQDAYWMKIERSAAASGTSNARYADLGQWATMAYQVSGSPMHAEKAWARIRRRLGKTPSDRNITREHFIDYAWMYDWLKPALSEEQRREFIAMMNHWCLLVLDRVPGTPWGTRMADSDETVGHYFGLALWALVSAEENPQAMEYLRSPAVGGLQATGRNRATWRNTIFQYAQSARGGVWLESSEYNLGTLRLLLLGAEAIRTATGRDDFPELTALADEIAAAQLHELTSDLRSAYQWGDLEHPRSLQMHRRAALLAVLSGTARDDAAAGRMLALLEALPWEELPPREFVLYHPFRPKRLWTDQPLWYVAPGMGAVFARDTWAPSGSLFIASLAGRPGVDHEVRYLGDFQLYRNGEWVLTHPLGYDATEGEIQNTMLVGGWGGMREARGLLEAKAAADGIVAAVGGTGGSLYRQWDIAPAPAFLHEWTRSLVYVPGRNGGSDVILVHDRVLMDDPRTLPRYSAYSAQDRRRMDRELARGLKQWIVHMPVEPLVEGRTISWVTPQGEPVQVRTLLPEDTTTLVYQEGGAGLPMPKYVQEGERGWQARVCSPRDGWETFLHVIQVGSQPVEATLVREDTLEGVRLVRPGQADRVVLFNAQPGQRLSKGLSVPGLAVHRKGLLQSYRRPNAVVIR